MIRQMMAFPASPEAAIRFLNFVNASPTPFHAVSNAAIHLEKAGFQKVHSCRTSIINFTDSWQLKEGDSWESDLRGGGKYYFTRYA